MPQRGAPHVRNSISGSTVKEQFYGTFDPRYVTMLPNERMLNRWYHVIF